VQRRIPISLPDVLGDQTYESLARSDEMTATADNGD
jgi:hypothetical protein